MESNLRDILGQFQYSSYYADHDDTILNNQLDLAEKAINRLIVEAKIEQLDEIIDIQEKQFNRWTQKDIAHFFERVGVIYRKLTKELGSLDDK